MRAEDRAAGWRLRLTFEDAVLERVVIVHRLTLDAMRTAARALPPGFFDASGR